MICLEIRTQFQILTRYQKKRRTLYEVTVEAEWLYGN